jgi:hypothetical protein
MLPAYRLSAERGFGYDYDVHLLKGEPALMLRGASLTRTPGGNEPANG